ncbi:hypothetical protein N7448_004280 [Penicillium atrosanguineum]|uniref:WD repeat protein n=1 Tax=Penicillium atrosanguineum TaxID=1132637 RepID=A0A9W9U569_9EURO|nr:uncharacterized protein N7443_003245 [Penicillium atrosanguineum]KAJ5140872.1 hypothetical protein N7448_004280 [Penicillium atrosanguineum]KAJ5310784.1 hypothetical protein N7443_003245 [Penicillium atrosanguineum]KAJ5316308.1 hypothetical protein N7476_006615 [Penicillium atrosanguineum]
MSMDIMSANTLAPTRDAMASEEDQRLHDFGVAALAAVAQHPHAVNEESGSLLMNEVVNAMTGGALPPNPSALRLFQDDSLQFPNSRRMNFAASFIPESVPVEPVAFSAGPQIVSEASDLNVDISVQQLIERAAPSHSIADAESNYYSEDDDMSGDNALDFEPGFEGNHSSPWADPDDDLEDLIRFYPDEEEFYHWQHTPYTRTDSPMMGEVNLDEFYATVSYSATDPSLPQTPANPGPGPIPLSEDQPEVHPETIVHTATYERNLTVDEFIQRWMIQTNLIYDGFHAESRPPAQIRPLSKMMGWKPALDIERPSNLKRNFYDLQQIPWREILKVKRSTARHLRDTWYTSYHNLDYTRMGGAERLPADETYFRGKSMHTAHMASIEHFQLRNLMAVPYYNTVHFASRSKVQAWTPQINELRCLIDLTRPCPESGFLSAVKISSMKSAYGLTMAGGFCGEYALRSSNAEGSGAKGLVTPDFNDGITNHVDIIPSRTGPSPICVFASNDRHLRVLDCETNIFLSDQELSRPINCTATSPDSRLRVVIGDSPEAWVIEADTGRPVHPLRGHRDFGFACAWSPDMRHIATSNQDKTLIIWDARTWKPLETIDSDVAGYRSLRFSPVGGGPRTLLCCEPADRISIVDAQLFQSRQVHDFFGEIGGADYAPDGGSVWVANTDPHFGGFMQYERCQWGSSFGLTDLPNEWLRENELDGDDRCILSERERSLRFLRNLSDEQHDAFIL